jgi:hypothetical protein
VTLYRQIIGSLNWLACSTRPDISLAVSLASQVLENPAAQHVSWANHILRYLKGTPDLGLRYSTAANTLEGHCNGTMKGDLLEGFSDSDWAGCPETRKSHSGCVFMLNDGPVSWLSKKQTCVSRSSTEAELVALDHAAAEAVFLREVIDYMGVPQKEPTPLHEDNSGCVHLAEHEASFRKTKHMHVKYFYVRELVEEKTVRIVQCGTDDQLADIFTKILGPSKFLMFRQRLMGA